MLFDKLSTDFHIVRGFILIFLLIASPSLKAEILEVSISASVFKALPQTTQRIIRALDKTGYEVNLTVLPNKRSLAMLRRGEVALEFFRTPSVTRNFPELILLKPLLRSINFNMVTSIRTPNHCLLMEEGYQELSIAGVLGIGLHQIDFYPKFRHSTSVVDVPTALKFVALQRADVTFLPNEVVGLFPPELTRDLIVCPANYKSFPFFAHLHKDFAWAKEKIESALHAEFVTTRDNLVFE